MPMLLILTIHSKKTDTDDGTYEPDYVNPFDWS